jgi:hypothetical protein
MIHARPMCEANKKQHGDEGDGDRQQYCARPKRDRMTLGERANFSQVEKARPTRITRRKHGLNRRTARDGIKNNRKGKGRLFELTGANVAGFWWLCLDVCVERGARGEPESHDPK